MTFNYIDRESIMIRNFEYRIYGSQVFRFLQKDIDNKIFEKWQDVCKCLKV